MKRERKTITPDMVRKYFGRSAKISSFAGRYTVKTPNGGKVKISQSKITTVYGGSDVYRAVVLLEGEAWGGCKVNGPPEFKLAMIAHGEAEGVNVQVGERGRWARMIVSVLVAWVGITLSDPGVWTFVWLLVSGGVWRLMKCIAKRQAQEEADQLGFAFPRVGGDPRDALREDAEREGWL
jgi:hypothetical protein